MPQMSISTAIRFNQLATIDHFDSKDGVMTVTAIARAPGVMSYRNRNGSVRRELVSREFLRRLDENGEPLIGKLGGISVVNEHPIDGLLRNDADRLSRYKVGETHNDVHVFADGKVRVTFDVFDPATQDDIKFGRKDGVSLGYETNVKYEPGTWHGEHFDAMQDEPFAVDHLAVCKTPRAAGAKIQSFKFDSADTTDIAWQIDSVEASQSASADQPVQPTGKKPMTYTLTIGNRPIVLDSADDAEAINALIAKVDSLQTKLDVKKKASEADDEEEDDEDDAEDGDDDDMTDKHGKPLPAFIKKKMKAKNDAIADLTDRLDSLTSEMETKDGELAVLQSIVGRADAEEETEHLDADAIATVVQERLDGMFTAYEDAKDYLPAGFKLDSSATPTSIYASALSSLGEDFHLDSEEAIAGAYTAMKRFSPKRQDSSSQLNNMLYQTLPASTTRTDATPMHINQLAELKPDDPRLDTLDFRTQAMVRSRRLGIAKITPGVN